MSAHDIFGFPVAIDGNVIIVGAYGDDISGVNNGGSAHVFEFVAGAWTEAAILTAPAPSTDDFFGFDVDVSGDTVVVGAPDLDYQGYTDNGAVFVFTKTGGAWVQQAQLVAPTPQNGILFGRRAAIEGDTVIVGAPFFDVGNNANQGAAYVLQRTGTTWVLNSSLTSPLGASGDKFGSAVAIGAGRIVVGSPLSGGAGGADQGTVTVYSQQFGLWSFEQQLVAASSAMGDLFGYSVAIDGQTIAVGGSGVDAVGTDSGATFIFSYCGGALQWQEKARVLPWDASAGDWFGVSVGLSGSTLISGAYGFNGLGSDVGAAYIHELSQGAFETYGFGDGSGAPCPCTNDSLPGLGQGCLNSGGVGGILSAWGSDVAAASDLVFVAGNLRPSAPALLFAGDSWVAGGAGIPFGDGLRVAGGFTVRLQVVVPDLNGNASWGPFSGAQGGWSAGATRYFQAWYRDPIGGPCSSGFNLTNGLRVDYQ